jgi:hypothetical protein
MFNANQEDTALQRMLAAAGLITNQATATGEGSRADLAAQLGAGNTQYQINQAKLNANPIYLQMLAGLNNPIPVGAYTSRTGTMNGTTNSTSKTTQSDPMGTFANLLSGAGGLMSGLGAMKFGAA